MKATLDPLIRSTSQCCSLIFRGRAIGVQKPNSDNTHAVFAKADKLWLRVHMSERYISCKLANSDNTQL